MDKSVEKTVEKTVDNVRLDNKRTLVDAVMKVVRALSGE